MLKTVVTYLGSFIGVASGVVGLWQAGNQYLARFASETQIAVVSISFFGLYYFGAYVFTTGAMKRKTRYANALNDLNRGFEEIHSLTDINSIDNEKFLMRFNSLCDSLSDAFTKITETTCAVSIKIMQETGNEPHKIVSFITLCRDKNSSTDRSSLDDKAKEKGVFHELIRNTAYREAFANTERFYFNNYLPFDYDFQSTMFDVCDQKPAKMNPLMRWHQWPLKYKSGIVIAISPPISRISQASHTKNSIIGFLCVDSNSMGAFHRIYDVQLLKGVASGIYNTLVVFKHKI
ncbi:hypothetical protein [Spirosoma sp.]|uniref:hypothetical protein n=1 Tax=Spirosoma sp. TaxID=1899569 RepID=UPI003B3AAE3A